MASSRIDQQVSTEQATRSCVNWIALLLDSEVRPDSTDSAFAEVMALLRSPAPTERSLKMALADGRLLDRLVQRVGVAPIDAPKCAGADEPLKKFVLWFGRNFNLGREIDATRIDANLIASCLSELVCRAASRDYSLPLFNLSSSGRFADMLLLPEPEAVSPVELELVKIINYYRLALAVGQLLAKSPLSYWPKQQVEDAFACHGPLLDKYCQIRAELGSAKEDRDLDSRLEAALHRHLPELGQLHAKQVSSWQLVNAFNVYQLIQKEPRRQRQVRLALKRLTSGDLNWSNRDMEQLQLMPAFHIKSLLNKVNQMANRGNSEPLNRAKKLISNVDTRLDLLVESLEDQVKPSLSAIQGLGSFHRTFKNLGILRLQNLTVNLVTMQADQQRRMRLRCHLWDAALVLSCPETGTIERTVEVTPDTEFQLASGVNTLQVRQQWGHLLLACDSKPDCEALLNAGNAAKLSRYPRCEAKGHSFQQKFFDHETLFENSESCSRCRQALVGFCYECKGACGMKLDKACIGTLSTDCRRDAISRSQSLSSGAGAAVAADLAAADHSSAASRRRVLHSVGGGSTRSRTLDESAGVYDRM
ncbi:hypothetical protein BOX15_Mlig006844g1 [Macrostomum lignano]|uniref:Uncharacterized protein n=1 Tax=Macrostomum lignano TaxID=282301 RepID=A0A267EWA5_9PLAT|nr:hypothetical protein BOX15_Mlig006844g1 [Macrostomum lignano]